MLFRSTSNCIKILIIILIGLYIYVNIDVVQSKENDNIEGFMSNYNNPDEDSLMQVDYNIDSSENMNKKIENRSTELLLDEDLDELIDVMVDDEISLVLDDMNENRSIFLPGRSSNYNGIKNKVTVKPNKCIVRNYGHAKSLDKLKGRKIGRAHV